MIGLELFSPPQDKKAFVLLSSLQHFFPTIKLTFKQDKRFTIEPCL